MKLTLKIKLLPSESQKEILASTMRECNSAAHNIAAWGVAVNTPEKSNIYCSLR